MGKERKPLENKKEIHEDYRLRSEKIDIDEDGIRTHACRAHWISSPTP